MATKAAIRRILQDGHRLSLRQIDEQKSHELESVHAMRPEKIAGEEKKILAEFDIIIAAENQKHETLIRECGF